MSKVKLVIKVQDEDCSKCPFYSYSCFERGYCNIEKRCFCTLFRCDLKNNKPCTACLSCREESDNEKK